MRKRSSKQRVPRLSKGGRGARRGSKAKSDPAPAPAEEPTSIVDAAAATASASVRLRQDVGRIGLVHLPWCVAQPDVRVRRVDSADGLVGDLALLQLLRGGPHPLQHAVQALRVAAPAPAQVRLRQQLHHALVGAEQLHLHVVRPGAIAAAAATAVAEVAAAKAAAAIAVAAAAAAAAAAAIAEAAAAQAAAAVALAAKTIIGLG